MGQVGHKSLIAMIAILALALIGWLPSSNQTKTYQVVIDDVFAQNMNESLKINTPVTFNRVVVGTLTQIEFNETNPRQLRLIMDINAQAPITQGTHLVLKHLPQITLIDEGQDNKLISSSPGQQYPNIATLRTITFKFAQNDAFVEQSEKTHTDKTALQEISDALKQQNKLLENFLTDDNTESIKQLVYSLQEISSVLSANKEKVNNILVHTDDFINDIKPLMASAGQSVNVLNSQTLPQVYTLMNNLNESLELVRELLMNINENPTLLIRGKRTPKLGPGEVISYAPSAHRNCQGCRL